MVTLTASTDKQRITKTLSLQRREPRFTRIAIYIFLFIYLQKLGQRMVQILVICILKNC